MASARALARLEALVWVLIYGGLFAVVLGIATGERQPGAAWSLGLGGAVAVACGIVLIFVRSRLGSPAAGGTTTTTDTPRKNP